LARALSICFNITPIIVTEYENIEIFKSLFAVTGLQIGTIDKASYIPRRVIFEPFPINQKFALPKTKKILEQFKPAAIIAIEKASWNEKKVYHNGHGMDISNMVAKTDILINEAKNRGILTIGIGDGGNEIGMGVIADAIKKIIPTGRKCICPCQAGIAAATTTDSLIVASVANWGSYGLETCLAIATDTPQVLHNGTFERFILEASIRSGIVDPSTGLSDGLADGTDTDINVYLVEILNKIIEYKNPNSWRKKVSRASKTDIDSVLEKIERYGRYLLQNEHHIFKDLEEA